LDSAIEHGRTWLASHEIYSAEGHGKVFALGAEMARRDARQKNYDGLLATIEEMRNPNHPWRIELKRRSRK